MLPCHDLILILGTCEYVTLHGKRNFADMIVLRTLRWKDCPRLPEWARFHIDPSKQRTFLGLVKEKDVTIKEGQKDMT